MIRIAALIFTVFSLWFPVTDSPQKEKFEVTVWASDDATKDNDVVRIREHGPCSGLVADLRTDRLPSWDRKRTFYSELVIEFDSNRKIIGRWPMPVDTVVHGLSGDSIIVKLYHGEENELIAIGRTGDMVRFEGELVNEPVLIESCPKFAEFGETAYLTCYLFIDLKNGKNRNFAFESPCT